MQPALPCPDCDVPPAPASLPFVPVSRREFVRVVSLGAAAAALGQVSGTVSAADPAKPAPETLVQKLYNTLAPRQTKNSSVVYNLKPKWEF